MKIKTCLVLGGNGFIGKNLLKTLLVHEFMVSSFDVSVPSEKLDNVRYIAGDFTDDDTIKSLVQKYDVIIHLISTITPRLSMQKPIQGYSVDVLQAFKILETLKGTNTSVIFASSGGTVYGQPEKVPVSERHLIAPIVHYGIVKATIEQLLLMYNKVYGMNNKVMRISNPYGPGQDYKKGVGIINALLRNALDRETTTIWGDGTAVKDYIYIDDLCEYICRYIEYSGNAQVLNIGSGIGNSINELINIVQKLTDKKLDITFESAIQNDIHNIVLDVNKAQKELGYTPKYSIISGIKKYIEETQKNIFGSL